MRGASCLRPGHPLQQQVEVWWKIIHGPAKMLLGFLRTGSGVVHITCMELPTMGCSGVNVLTNAGFNPTRAAATKGLLTRLLLRPLAMPTKRS